MNQRLAAMREVVEGRPIAEGRPVPIGSMVELADGKQFQLSPDDGGRLIHVQLVRG